ncbi:2-hydroxyacid dehydrogenase [Shimia sp.]|uniref:2-hydroxyacid dehydrogenase n=1 Tax=Shimia sp. TaxID=1954381 RepID=UPI0032972C92
MTKPQVLVMSPIWPSVLQDLERHFVVYRLDLAEDKADFLNRLGGNCRAAIISGHYTFGEEELQRLPQLEILACNTAGFEMIDDSVLRQNGIPFTNASLALSDEVADTAVMLTLAARKELVKADAYVRSGEWGAQGPYPLLSSLKGKRAGILGLGIIGQEIANRLQALKLDIGYCTRRRKDNAYRYFPDAVSLANWSDILIVAVPGGAETEGMIDKSVLSELGTQGTLINIARGSVVDEEALISCLTSGALGSAGLDVFLNEPDPDPRLTELRNVVLYPHHASGTNETRCAMSQLALNNLIAHFSGASLISPVFELDQRNRTIS